MLHETGSTRDPLTLAHAAERVSGALRDELTELIGAGGVGALVRRALTLAQRSSPLLAGVEARQDGSLVGLAEALGGSASAQEVEAAGAALLDSLIGLLVSLMGEELGLRPVRRLWPGLDLGGGFHEGTG